mmetsp:Transcript_13577/g.42245  ORF Transcript_13577/g.42245 Transcript_13577/m.42245 type:complete len:220 (+) Transcript_13577:1580-2239(+)
MHAGETTGVDAALHAARRHVGMRGPCLRGIEVCGVGCFDVDARQRVRRRDDRLHVAEAQLASKPAPGVRARRGAIGLHCGRDARRVFLRRGHVVVGVREGAVAFVVARRLVLKLGAEPARRSIRHACRGERGRGRLCRGGLGRQQRAGAVRSSGGSMLEGSARQHGSSPSLALPRVGVKFSPRGAVVVVAWRRGEHGVAGVVLLGRCAAHFGYRTKAVW